MRHRPWTPHDYQVDALRFLLAAPERALFLEPGLGKTSIAAKGLQLMRENGWKGKALVVAPLRPAYSVWTQEEGGELAKWADFAGLRVELLHGHDKEEAIRRDADLYVINFDGLPWLLGGKDDPMHLAPVNRLLDRGLDTLVVDELSKFKHTNSKRFKTAKRWLPRFKRRWGLTGSPAANGLLDCFGQLFVVDLGTALGAFVTHYRARYFMTPPGLSGKAAQFTFVLKPGADKEIYKAMSKTALAMKAEDHLDLPELVEQNVWVNLPAKARAVYDEMWEDLVAQVQGGLVIAKNAGVASMKCRQIASGGLWVEDQLVPGKRPGRHLVDLHDEKTEALVDLHEELNGQPLLVAYEFDHDHSRIVRALGDAPSIRGGTKPAESRAIEAAWNRGELKLLLGHPAAMGHGLNLQGAGNHVAWYTMTWDFELYDQTVRRVYRQGNDHKRVFVHRILTRKTVDEAVAKAISSKNRTQVGLYRALMDMAEACTPSDRARFAATMRAGKKKK